MKTALLGVAVLVSATVASSTMAVCDFSVNPLDCVQVIDPHLTKTVFWGPGPVHCGGDSGNFWFVRAGGGGGDIPVAGSGVDAAGNLYTLDSNEKLYRHKPDGTRELVAVGSDSSLLGLEVDTTSGRIFVSITGGGCTLGSIIALEGLPTLFEMLQTFTPQASALTFRVPAMPEGLPAADYFDTYYGDLATVGDWGKAQPLQCGFPTSSPSVGDYLTVADPLPNPSPNTGRYYVTAVNHQGQRKYGRQRLNGVLSGRDPAVLPGCGD